jgi:hypothetical protein
MSPDRSSFSGSTAVQFRRTGFSAAERCDYRTIGAIAPALMLAHEDPKFAIIEKS